MELRLAVAALYRAFAGYPFRPDMVGCPHCLEPDEHLPLDEKPLLQLSRADLWLFATKALTTWGDDLDLRHFLPRLLELLAEEQGWVDPATLLGKLSLAGWTDWPLAEQHAINCWLLAWWRRALASPPHERSAWSTLQAIGATGTALTPFLHEWRRDLNDNATLQLAQLLLENEGTAWKKGSLSRTGFLPEQLATLVDWLRSAETPQRLEAAFFRTTDEQTQSDLSRAAQAAATLTRPRRP